MPKPIRDHKKKDEYIRFQPFQAVDSPTTLRQKNELIGRIVVVVIVLVLIVIAGIVVVYRH